MLKKTRKPKRILIAGGSISGLIAGIVIKEKGHSVHIYERSSQRMKSRGAGIVLQPEVIDFFQKYHIASAVELGVPLSKRKFIYRGGNIVERDMQQWMTSWDTLYEKLQSYYPDEGYTSGREITSFRQKNDEIVVKFNNGDEETCDLLIGADGIGSSIRRQLLPETDPVYAGYIAWRGVVNEQEASPELWNFFHDRFTFYQGLDTQILCYVIPEARNGKGLGKRLNWVWYVNVLDQAELQNLLTDEQGRRYRFFMPPASFKEIHVRRQKQEAAKLPGQFQQLVHATSQPFAQPIYDLAVPQMVLGNVCLIGDAAFVPRPHTAASTAKAVTNALEMAEALEGVEDIEDALQQWNSSQVSLGQYIGNMGIDLGKRSNLGY